MIWLIGSRGMLGSEVEALLKRESRPCAATDIDIDITDLAALRDFAARGKISWIINCSAYTAVDAAEDDRERAFAINADGAGNIALVAGAIGAGIIHVSTDYVFNGQKEEAYSEEDAPDPAGVYGRSKLEGERQVAAAAERHFIIRTAWLYGAQGNNFVRTMLRLFREREEVRVVADQWGSPTLAKDLAAAILAVVDRKSERYGIYNYTNEGRASWHEFAVEIYGLARRRGIISSDVRILPITTDQYPTRARRPRNSYLSKEKIVREMGVRSRHWREALEEFIMETEI